MPLKPDFTRRGTADPMASFQKGVQGASNILDTIASEHLAKKKYEDTLKQQAFENQVAQERLGLLQDAEQRAKEDFSRKQLLERSQDIFGAGTTTGTSDIAGWLDPGAERLKNIGFYENKDVQGNITYLGENKEPISAEEAARRSKIQEQLGALAGHESQQESQADLLRRSIEDVKAQGGVVTPAMRTELLAAEAADTKMQKEARSALQKRLDEQAKEYSELEREATKFRSEKKSYKPTAGGSGGGSGEGSYKKEDWKGAEQADMEYVTLLGANVGDAEDVSNAYKEGKILGAPIEVVQNAVSKQVNNGLLGNSVPDEEDMREAVRLEYEIYKKRKGGGAGGREGSYDTSYEDTINNQLNALKQSMATNKERLAILDLTPEEQRKRKADMLFTDIFGNSKTKGATSFKQSAETVKTPTKKSTETVLGNTPIITDKKELQRIAEIDLGITKKASAKLDMTKDNTDAILADDGTYKYRSKGVTRTVKNLDDLPKDKQLKYLENAGTNLEDIISMDDLKQAQQNMKTAIGSTMNIDLLYDIVKRETAKHPAGTYKSKLAEERIALLKDAIAKYTPIYKRTHGMLATSAKPSVNTLLKDKDFLKTIQPR